ncbi:hypothetical protein [Larkinella knui]|uniref:Uncharacterized protein n=1 Tax=Larkinella knui TaxID=2025310 RepID=A0A3P1CAJ0_9BACT|nr:hypothetical protein [Larkinella knui]RRB10332.1 hypothetical protein EHT87_29335 [Larkinella knui]
MAAPPSTPDDQTLYLSQIEPVITQTLATDFSFLPETAIDLITSKTLTTALHIRRVATKQRLNRDAFAKRLTREQAQVWLAVHGDARKQAAAMNQIMAENRATVQRFLSTYTFRTTDQEEDVLNESFRTFFEMINHQKPVMALIATVVKGVARFKALKQVGINRKDSWQWLETPYESDGDDDIGTFDYPMPPDENPEPESIDLHLRLEEIFLENTAPGGPDDFRPVLKRIDFGELQRSIADCFKQLRDRRQLLLRFKYAFWKGYDQGPLSDEAINSDQAPLSDEAIDSSFDKLSMEQIAELAGYKDAHTASVRLKETRQKIYDCLKRKLNITPAAR